MNVDSLRIYGAITDLVNNLQRGNIDIARIQDTHNENKLRNISKLPYILWWGERDSNNSHANRCIGGVGIAIKSNLVIHIKSINRINERLMDIRLANNNNNKNISIINSYAPHMGYGNKIIEEYRNDINNHFGDISHNYYKWWLFGYNGKIVKNLYNIGKWTYRKY